MIRKNVSKNLISLSIFVRIFGTLDDFFRFGIADYKILLKNFPYVLKSDVKRQKRDGFWIKILEFSAAG